ncbi:MAG: 2-C-methyl-D-erythritol 2,4-cyclodiphosphate synthase [Acidobacteriota bacterium]
MTSRVGIGFDAHPFVPGRPLRLGGVVIPYRAGLKGHSDGDALLHAIADAILGAAGLASLGEHFPDDDAATEGADSGSLLSRVSDVARRNGFTIENVDAVVIGEAPKIAPHREAIRARVAKILDLSVEVVNVRGTSSNGLGFPGRGEGIGVMAVVLLRRDPPDSGA